MHNRGKNVQGRIYWLQERETSLILTLFSDIHLTIIIQSFKYKATEFDYG